MTTSRILAWYQNPKKHQILAQFINSPWTRCDQQLPEAQPCLFYVGSPSPRGVLSRYRLAILAVTLTGGGSPSEEESRQCLVSRLYAGKS